MRFNSCFFVLAVFAAAVLAAYCGGPGEKSAGLVIAYAGELKGHLEECG
jgi:hypothetical protein